MRRRGVGQHRLVGEGDHPLAVLATISCCASGVDRIIDAGQIAGLGVAHRVAWERCDLGAELVQTARVPSETPDPEVAKCRRRRNSLSVERAAGPARGLLRVVTGMGRSSRFAKTRVRVFSPLSHRGGIARRAARRARRAGMSVQQLSDRSIVTGSRGANGIGRISATSNTVESSGLRLVVTGLLCRLKWRLGLDLDLQRTR